MLERLYELPSFLMVGTLEPRKGHAQALEAFEQLWAQGENVALVVVGLPGWMTDVLQRRIRHHDELGKRLFWFMQASDALVEKLYATCTVLLASSQGEGFGLPLVEAARHGLPVLARDMPIFREVAGTHATYFSGLDAASLASAVREWLAAQQRGDTPAVAGMPAVTWSESAAQLVHLMLDSAEPARIRPTQGAEQP
jgi:glycosyltransferase involved in cell wall biosynthesis